MLSFAAISWRTAKSTRPTRNTDSRTKKTFRTAKRESFFLHRLSSLSYSYEHSASRNSRKPDDQPQLEKVDDTSQSPLVPKVHSPTHDDQAGKLDAGDQTLVDVEVEAQDKGPLQAFLGSKSIGGDNLLNREASYKGQRRYSEGFVLPPSVEHFVSA